MIACMRCGHPNAETAKFCSECGAPLADTGQAPAAHEERRIVTVLFADLVGFTSRAERLDPEDVHALLGPYHTRVKQELERFGGTVEKFIGDAVMALFGATVAHEDDPERAVRAGLAIRDWAEGETDLQIRIGVTTGEALVSLGARPEAGEGMASGDVVNTAARLEAAAPVGAILVDDATRRATERVIGYVPADPVIAKGKAEPVPAWRAIEALSRLGVDVRQHGGAPLVGRSRELHVLTDALDRVKQRAEPELVTLVGVPGMGKSRLVFELLQHVDRDPDLVTWRQGRSIPYGDGVTFWALGEMVKAQLGILETDGVAEASDKLERGTAELVGDAGEVARIARHLRPLIGLATSAEPANDRGEVFAAWRHFFESLASVRPLVLVFEDLHWADDNVLDFIDHLVDWAGGASMLVVATARPELLTRRPGWGGGKANATTLSLHALTDEETAELVKSLLDRAIAPREVQAELLGRAGGNPLYAEEFARMIAERVGRAGDGGDLLPESVQGIIAARLDTLPRDEKALLQNASVVGKVFWRGSVARIGGDPPGLDDLLHNLERKEFIRREPRPSVSGESEFAFRHVLVRDVAYGQIPRARRAEKHLQSAAWIESLGEERADDRAEMLVHHYVTALEFTAASGNPTDDLRGRARSALADAGDHALALNAPMAAAGFYARALEMTAADEAVRPDLLFRHAQALYGALVDDAIPVAEDARDALLVVGDTRRAAHAEQMVSRLWWYRGRSDLAYAHMERARSLIGDDRSSEAAIRVLANAARLLAIASEPEEALRIAREVEPSAEALELDAMRANLATTIGMARIDLLDPGGMADMERARQIAIASGSLGEIATATQNYASRLYEAGETVRGWALAHEAMEVAVRAGSVATIAFQEAVLSFEGYDTGEWDDAVDTWDRMIEDPGRAQTQRTGILCKRAQVRLARDDVTGALDDLQQAFDASGHRGESRRYALATAARIHADLGDLGAARRNAAELFAGRDRDLDAYEPIASVLRQLGHAAAMHERFDHLLPVSRYAAAMLALADGSFAEAAELFEAMEIRPEEARARQLAGAELMAAGRRAEGEAQLRRALEFYRKVAATRYAREVEELLAQTTSEPG